LDSVANTNIALPANAGWLNATFKLSACGLPGWPGLVAELN
jgi:hypothetical protein